MKEIGARLISKQYVFIHDRGTTETSTSLFFPWCDHAAAIRFIETWPMLLPHIVRFIRPSNFLWSRETHGHYQRPYCHVDRFMTFCRLCLHLIYIL